MKPVLFTFILQVNLLFTLTASFMLPSKSAVPISTHQESDKKVALALNAIPSRRNVLQTIAASSVASLFHPSRAQASDTESSKLVTGLLEGRVLENVLSPPPYGMEGNDIYYPRYFNGVWDVFSTTVDVKAPCGILLFGGNNTYTRAQNEVGTSLVYKARFINSSSQSTPSVIADREYNVVEIAKAAMGNNAVLEVPLSTPNKVSVILAPNNSNQILKADLITLNRRSEDINSCEFHCSEVVRQVIAPAKPTPNTSGGLGGSGARSMLLKEIETASLYTAVKDDEGNVQEIRCRQRSATFLLPSQQDPMAFKMWEASRGRPIDVRFYDVVYTKRA